MLYSWDTGEKLNDAEDRWSLLGPGREDGGFESPGFDTTPSAPPADTPPQTNGNLPPGAASPGTHWEMNPTTGEWAQVGDGEQPPWGAIVGGVHREYWRDLQWRWDHGAPEHGRDG